MSTFGGKIEGADAGAGGAGASSGLLTNSTLPDGALLLRGISYFTPEKKRSTMDEFIWLGLLIFALISLITDAVQPRPPAG
jgi:hypothetical protein